MSSLIVRKRVSEFKLLCIQMQFASAPLHERLADDARACRNLTVEQQRASQTDDYPGWAASLRSEQWVHRCISVDNQRHLDKINLPECWCFGQLNASSSYTAASVCYQPNAVEYLFTTIPIATTHDRFAPVSNLFSTNVDPAEIRDPTSRLTVANVALPV